ncbi:MAG: epoxide hydrolase family protein [Pseudolysinimonas sp.]
MHIEPFRATIDPSVLRDLRLRLAATRWPDAAPGEAWSQGTDREWLRDFVDDWGGQDAVTVERELNAHPQFIADVDGTPIHFVHLRRGGPALILTHGWPSAYLEYLPLIDLLPDYDLVIPSLPGYGFSGRPAACTTRDVAALWATLMTGLGYERFGAVGSDFGSAVATYLGLDFPDRVTGIHLSNLDVWPTAEPETDDERAFLAVAHGWDATERGYSFIQGTRPQTLSYGLTDSPAGLAAWILEKWRAWGDTDGDVDARFGRAFLLTLMTLYWMTGTIGSSIRDYIDNRDARTGSLPPGVRVEIPVGFADFGANFVPEGRVPRSWVERGYTVTRFSEMPHGGHFAAREEPELLAGEIRAFFASI